MNMSEQNPRDIGDGHAIRDYWQATSAGTAVLWWEFSHNGVVTMTAGPESIVMYQHVDFDALRSIPLTKMQAHRNGYPEFDQSAPPTPEQIRKAWVASASARARAENRSAESVGSFAGRAEGESTDDFYSRVAAFYRVAAVSTGQPTKTLAESAGVPKTTAARWVREARTRGHLDKTTRGRGKA